MSEMYPSFTKRGPGRRPHSANERAKHFTTIKQKSAGEFGKTLTAAFAAVRAEKLVGSNGPRDDHGAYTLTGRDPLHRFNLDGSDSRRKWLAGISAQRGY